jgi:hypothetical protein
MMTRYHFDYIEIEHPALVSFADLARAFCTAVERGQSGAVDAFAAELHGLIAKLYAHALELPSTDVLYSQNDAEEEDVENDGSASGPDPDRLDANAWRDLYSELSEQFNSANRYREVFDPYEASEEEPVTGSLADDVADIYQDVRSGLLKWERGESGPALWEWRFNFEVHWGEHATGALRALHAWASWWDGPWPTGQAYRRQGGAS